MGSKVMTGNGQTTNVVEKICLNEMKNTALDILTKPPNLTNVGPTILVLGCMTSAHRHNCCICI